MVNVAIVGTGFGGIGAALKLKELGVTDLVLFEKSDDVGGVWRENTYPGAACDVPSHLYSFSFAPQGAWSRRFAPQAEIHAYLRRVAVDFGVVPHVRFGTEVLSADHVDGRWHLALSTGETHVADLLITACGQLSRPSRPTLPGLEDFSGTVFHSAEWDHAHDLRGERVAVIGTGASAIQFVPAIADEVASLTVFQRTAPHVIRKPDRAYGPRTRAALDRFPVLLKADRLRTFVQNESRTLGFNVDPRFMKPFEISFRRRLASSVKDPVLREKLTPHDPIGCKRILISNDWYPALVKPHVRVVDSAVTAVRPDAVVSADGEVHQVDTIILGTGFAATELLAPMVVRAPDGRTLTDAWADGAEAYLGSFVAGFPNLFLMYGPNTNLGHNSIILMLESQLRLLVDGVRRLLTGELEQLDVRPEVMRAYNDDLQSKLKGTVFAQGCVSWYLTATGRNTQNWPASTLRFRWRLRRLDPAAFR